MLLRRAALALLLLPGAAFAQRDTTRAALERMQETLLLRSEDGHGLVLPEVLPALLVSAQPAFEETKAWYPAAATAALLKAFGSNGLRACEACMQPRLHVADGAVDQRLGEPSLEELTRLDAAGRGRGAPAKTAVWLDENAWGVSLRVVELGTGRIVLAENFDPSLKEAQKSKSNFALARELDRRARRDALTHTFIDFSVYPGQHVSFDWVEQWGNDNANLSGLTVSAFDPVIGIGATYDRVIPQLWNLTVGVKVLISLPTALVQALANNGTSLIDPLFNGVLVVRMPIASSNFGVLLTLSTNGRFGLGISLLNLTFLPFLP